MLDLHQGRVLPLVLVDCNVPVEVCRSWLSGLMSLAFVAQKPRKRTR